jgi:hypothetical protein
MHLRLAASLYCAASVVVAVVDRPPLAAKHVTSGPRLPFCRKQGAAATMWLPVHDADLDKTELEQRIVLFGGKG